jgi:hypothetical protein
MIGLNKEMHSKLLLHALDVKKTYKIIFYSKMSKSLLIASHIEFPND